MRILTVVEDLSPGGTQRNAQNLAIAYAEGGHESAVLAIRRGGPREGPLRDRGIGLFIGGEGGRSAEALAEAAAWRPRVVHVHRPGIADPETAGVIRHIKTACPERVGVIETNVFARVDYSADRLLFDVHTQIARWCLWKWRRWAKGLRPRPVGALLPYLVDTRGFYRASEPERRAFRESHGIPHGALVFGRIGSPNMSKWSVAILDAFEPVAAELPGAHLLLVGMPPEMGARLAALSDDVRRRVTAIPPVHGDAALRACYSAMDVFLHAALIGESFGMVLCESMLCGTPVVTLSTPAKDNAQLEVVGHQRGGLVVTDAAAMARAMRTLAADEGLRRRLGEGGAAWVKEQYSAETIRPLLCALAELVASEPSREALERKLESDGRFTVRVGDREIQGLLGAAIGTPSVRDRVLFRVVMNPWVYRVYQWAGGARTRAAAGGMARAAAGTK